MLGDARRYPLKTAKRIRIGENTQDNGAPSISNLAPGPSNYDMWRAYAIAPAVTPITFVAVVSTVGVTLPANVIAMGFLVCYMVAGLIGMPIAFSLRRNSSLNAWTIHGAALTWGMLSSLLCTVAVIYVVVTIGGTIQSLPLTIVWSFVLMVPPVVLAGTAFWLLIKNPKMI